MATGELTDNRAVWNRIAPWWDDFCGDEGDVFHREVIRPAVLGLLTPLPGERILDAGCGNGGFARHLARLGLRVTAFDQADGFIEAARSRPGADVNYRVVDGTDPEQLATLEGAPYDAMVANMVLMDMPEVGPLYSAASRLLRPGGRFVFSVIHPCFGLGLQPPTSPETDRSPKTRLLAGAVGVAETMTRLIPQRMRMSLVERVGAVVAGMASLRYLDSRQMPIMAAPDQPVAHWYFHRPLHELLSPAFEAGLVLDGLAEPPFSDRQTAQTGLLVCRLRRP
jgi:2-polyprenyl-3-methyl-5-hydroxy-6-metoxy-1,4-benzoquinol methylase